MAAANTFTITISAVDKATATVRKINEQMQKATAPMRDLRKSLGGFAAETGLDKAATSFKNVGSSAADCVKSISSMVPLMGAITATATVGGILALASSWGKLGQTLQNTASVLGVSTASLQAYQNAARLAGASSEDMTQSLKALGDTIEGATYGRNPQALQFMARFGMHLSKTKDGAVDSMKALRQLADAVAAQKGNVAAQRLILQTFGVSEALLPMLQKGSKGLEEYAAAGAKAGNVMSDTQTQAAADYAQNITKLDFALEGLKNTVGNDLIPVLTPLIEQFSQWVDKNKDLIATKVADAVKEIAHWIAEIAPKIPGLIDDFGKLVDKLGGVNGLAVILAGITFAGPIGGIATLIGSLTNLATTVAPAAIRALGGLAGMMGKGGAVAEAGEAVAGAAGGTGALAGAAAIAAPVAIAAGGSYLALKGAKAAGLPDTDRDKGIEAVRNGEWWKASALLPAADFARAMAWRAGGMSNADIAAKLRGPVAPAAVPAPTAAPATPAAGAAAAPVAAGGVMAASAPAGGSAALFAGLEKQYGLPAGLLDAVWKTESGRGKNMLSPAGAEGHFQFMPGTAKQYGVANPYDLTQSATGAAKMYHDLLKQSGGNLPAALAGYNWGMGNVQKKGLGAAPAETRGYIEKVTTAMAQGGTNVDMSTMPIYAAVRRPGAEAGAAGAAANGKVHVEITLANLPAGSKATTQTTGSVVATTRVREPMLTQTTV